MRDLLLYEVPFIAWILLPLVGRRLWVNLGYDKDAKKWRITTSAMVFLMAYAAVALTLGYHLFSKR
jgi:hypothetical protein